jgi:two-component system sensor histidine kinase FlrB
MLIPSIPNRAELALPAPEQPLSEAFSAFSEAARSLEFSYFSLGEEVRRLRQELEQERELRRRREALAEMAALVAHEVRNPLGSVELFAELLANSDLTTEKREWVVQIQAGLRILSASVNNVLQFHSPASSTLAPTHLGRVLQSLRQLLAPVAVKAEMKLTVDEGAEELWVLADQQQLMQAFLNVALNAFRFAAEGGRLRIGAKRIKGMAMVQFVDGGPGITDEVSKKIFEAGFTTRSGGPGLGMAVAKRIAEQHRGSISVTSVTGKGAVFEVQLPLVSEVTANDVVVNDLAVYEPAKCE